MPLYIEAQRAPRPGSGSGNDAPEGGGAAAWFNDLGDELIDGAIEESGDNLAQDFGKALGGLFGWTNDEDGCDC